jgi:carboxypeptidase family protein
VAKRSGALLGALAALTMAACSSGPGALPKVPEFTPAATTTTDVDYSQIPLKGVSGHGPTTSIALGPGQATVNGTVTGDDGAIAGATVQIERIANGASASTTVQSLDDGTWSLPQVLGGRYRVRAWRAPDLAQTTWSALFLGSTESKTVPLHVRSVGGLSVDASIAPNPPVVGQDANLVVLVTVKMVDDQGVVRATPQENVEVDLITNGAWRLFSPNPTATDSRGEAGWSVRCRASGHQSLAVSVGTQTVPLPINDCVSPQQEETTTTAEVGIVP